LFIQFGDSVGRNAQTLIAEHKRKEHAMSLLKRDWQSSMDVIHDAAATHKGVNAEISGDKKMYERDFRFTWDDKFHVTVHMTWVLR